jgi:hypothetical protein
MTARLTAFYHVDPWRLLAELPMAILWAFSKMLPRLQAERSLEACDQLAVGINAAFAEGSTAAPVRRWREAFHPSAPTTAVDRRASADATFSNARAFGIGVRVVKAR